MSIAQQPALIQYAMLVLLEFFGSAKKEDIIPVRVEGRGEELWVNMQLKKNWIRNEFIPTEQNYKLIKQLFEQAPGPFWEPSGGWRAPNWPRASADDKKKLKKIHSLWPLQFYIHTNMPYGALQFGDKVGANKTLHDEWKQRRVRLAAANIDPTATTLPPGVVTLQDINSVLMQRWAEFVNKSALLAAAGRRAEQFKTELTAKNINFPVSPDDSNLLATNESWKKHGHGMNLVELAFWGGLKHGIISRQISNINLISKILQSFGPASALPVAPYGTVSTLEGSVFVGKSAVANSIDQWMDRGMIALRSFSPDMAATLDKMQKKCVGTDVTGLPVYNRTCPISGTGRKGGLTKLATLNYVLDGVVTGGTFLDFNASGPASANWLAAAKAFGVLPASFNRVNNDVLQLLQDNPLAVIYPGICLIVDLPKAPHSLVIILKGGWIFSIGVGYHEPDKVIQWTGNIVGPLVVNTPDAGIFATSGPVKDTLQYSNVLREDTAHEQNISYMCLYNTDILRRLKEIITNKATCSRRDGVNSYIMPGEFATYSTASGRWISAMCVAMGGCQKMNCKSFATWLLRGDAERNLVIDQPGACQAVQTAAAEALSLTTCPLPANEAFGDGDAGTYGRRGGRGRRKKTRRHKKRRKKTRRRRHRRKKTRQRRKRRKTRR